MPSLESLILDISRIHTRISILRVRTSVYVSMCVCSSLGGDSQCRIGTVVVRSVSTHTRSKPSFHTYPKNKTWIPVLLETVNVAVVQWSEVRCQLIRAQNHHTYPQNKTWIPVLLFSGFVCVCLFCLFLLLLLFACLPGNVALLVWAFLCRRFGFLCLFVCFRLLSFSCLLLFCPFVFLFLVLALLIFSSSACFVSVSCGCFCFRLVRVLY